MKCCTTFLALLPLLLRSAPCNGANQDEIQVYDDSINKPGEFGLEIHLNTTAEGRDFANYPDEITNDHGFRYTYEFSFGITKEIEAGLYADTQTDGSGTFYFVGEKVRVKWIPLKADEKDGGFFAGMNWEYSTVGYRFSESPEVLELRGIMGWRNEDWLFAVNPVWDWNVSPNFFSIDPEFTASFKLTHKVVEGLFAGIEYYGDLGAVAHIAPLEQEDQRLYAVVDVDMKPYVFNFGVGYGFTRQADAWTIKAIIEVPTEEILKH